jgi:hypothetical protein
MTEHLKQGWMAPEAYYNSVGIKGQKQYTINISSYDES